MLEVRDLCSGYGSVPVLHDVNLTVEPGQIILIVGENGAGKTTLLRTIGGLIPATSGSVRLDGADITRLAPEHMTDRGLRLVLDGHRVFPKISVLDNLRLGATRRVAKAKFASAVDDVFAMFPVLREKLHTPAHDLSGGQQQMLALGQAFVAQPKALLCDEPSLGLAQALLPTILEFLQRWARLGTAVVIVEQHIRIALAVADRVLLMERGEITLNLPAAEFARSLRDQQSSQPVP
jgi:branched-chain amino acid transport system ATP-binding protein